jgi:flagellar biosynthesis/type III secretory pathway M-ring protein FliF/YscJ
MSVASSYAKIRSKVAGDDKAPWYTRWVWWIVIACAFGVVVLVWWISKRREADVRARAKLAKEEATKARLEALEEKDKEKAKILEKKAADAEKRVVWLERRVEESAAARREVEDAIKGATSWEELDAIDKDTE